MVFQTEEDYRELTEKHRKGYIIKKIDRSGSGRITLSAKLIGREVRIELVK